MNKQHRSPRTRQSGEQVDSPVSEEEREDVLIASSLVTGAILGGGAGIIAGWTIRGVIDE